MNAPRFKGWSYSRLIVFESCALRAKLQFVDRVPQEQSEAGTRGTNIHTLAEQFVRGNIQDLPAELSNFVDEFLLLCEHYAQGTVELESKWGFDADWNPVAWEDAVCRIVSDVFVRLSPTSGLVIDYKTGKRAGKEIRHGEQLQLYQLGAFLRYPELESLIVELWYLDENTTHSQQFTRHQGLKFLKSYEKRGNTMLQTTSFRPNPNVWSCRYCPYSRRGTGHCKAGV